MHLLKVSSTQDDKGRNFLPPVLCQYFHEEGLNLLHDSIGCCINREYVQSAIVHQKYLTRLGELIIFKPWRENCHFSQPS